MKNIKKIFAIIMATMIVLIFSMIYVSAAMDVVFYRDEKSGGDGTLDYTMTTDYYPNTTRTQVTSAISCGAGHTVYSESYGMIAFDNYPDAFFTQTSTVLSPSTSYISYAVTYLNNYSISNIYYVEGYHVLEYDGNEIVSPQGNTTRLYNNGTF